jgi:carboxyl-terminal processing protease
MRKRKSSISARPDNVANSYRDFTRNYLAKFFIVVVIGVSVFATSSIIADDLGKPTRYDKVVSQMVAGLMQRDHLSSRKLDDTISVRAFDQFIKTLDPMKVYFLKSDIDSFELWKEDLDDQMKSGDFSAALSVFKRFLERVDQRTALAAELIDVEHDFTIDEDMVTDRDLLSYAGNDDEAREVWRKRIKYSLLVLNGDKDEKEKEAKEKADSDKKPAKKVDPKEQLRKRYSSFARRMHQTDTEDVVEMYITAVTTSFDPHTSYMSKGTFENFLIQMGLELEGIGATLQATDDGYTVIKNIVPGGAAATQGGLKVEDKIMAVGQGDDEGARLYRKLAEEHGTDFVDATGMKLDDVVGMIRGKAGTVVRLSVQSENEEELHTVMIVREKIKLEDSAAHGVIFEEGVKNDGSPNKIGVIELPSFYANMGGGGAGGRSTTTDVRKILDDFTDKNVDAVVLDLRSNGGGSLREAIDCTGLFIDLGPVVQVKNAYGDIEKHNDEVSGMSWDGPLVVLTSKFSASASEILAGAVQDYGRGLVVGDTTTHGKGTVQSLINLNQIIYKVKNPPNDFGALKITMQQFYRPNGDSTQKRGVLSDLVLPSITDKMDVGESDLDYPVEFDQVPRASFKGYAMADEAIKKQLQLNSKERVDSSDDFASQVRKINHYVEQKNLKSVSLNQEKFLARRRQLNAEKEDEKAIEKQIIPSREIERTYYLDEVLRITSDYMNLLSKNS